MALAVLLAAMLQQNPACTMADVIYELRLAKEAASQRYAEEETARSHRLE